MSSAFILKHSLTFASLSAASSILFGAYGSHGLPLSSTISEKEQKAWESANKYQIYHSLALVALPAACPPALYPKAFVATSRLFIIGTTLFSGSIYTKVLLLKNSENKETKVVDESLVEASKNVGKGAPVGGSMLVAGWVVLGLLRRG